jgi:hypothetical protein
VRCSLSQTAVPPFGRTHDHSSVPAKARNAGERSGGRRPSSSRVSASDWTAASTPANWRLFVRTACWAMVVLSLFLWSTGTVLARSTSTMHVARSAAADPFASFIAEASQRFGIPAHWIQAVMHVESAGRLREMSSKGAMGLMQIMPKTWTELRARYRLGSDPYDPHDNILAGAAYLREMHDRYGAPGFLAAYNAGPGRYDRHLATGQMLPVETREYVAKLAPIIEPEHARRQIMVATSAPTWRRASMFVARRDGNSAGDRLSPSVHPDRTSNVRPVFDLPALVPQSIRLFVHRAREVRSQ